MVIAAYTILRNSSDIAPLFFANLKRLGINKVFVVVHNESSEQYRLTLLHLRPHLESEIFEYISKSFSQGELATSLMSYVKKQGFKTLILLDSDEFLDTTSESPDGKIDLCELESRAFIYVPILQYAQHESVEEFDIDAIENCIFRGIPTSDDTQLMESKLKKASLLNRATEFKVVINLDLVDDQILIAEGNHGLLTLANSEEYLRSFVFSEKLIIRHLPFRDFKQFETRQLLGRGREESGFPISCGWQNRAIASMDQSELRSLWILNSWSDSRELDSEKLVRDESLAKILKTCKGILDIGASPAGKSLSMQVSETDLNDYVNLHSLTIDRTSRLRIAVLELRSKRDQLTQERDQLTQERDQLTQERDQLTQERDQLTQERDQLTQERDQLTQERDQLTERLFAVLNSRTWKLLNWYRRIKKSLLRR